VRQAVPGHFRLDQEPRGRAILRHRWRLFPARPASLHIENHNPGVKSLELLHRLSDEELASELLAGRHDALVILFDRYHRLVFGVALRIVQDPGEAEEVVQTVFLAMFRTLVNFDPRRGMLKVWLLQFAYGRALHRRRHLVVNHFYDSVSLDADVGQPSSFRPNPSMAESSRLMEELLSTLNARRRLVVELTYFMGLTADEISVQLGLSVGVVRHELYRGLAKLRQAVKKTRSPIKEYAKARGKEALTPDAQAL
jgi:RNA polymerase sigma-70 factor (ECF subfamily)